MLVVDDYNRTGLKIYFRSVKSSISFTVSIINPKFINDFFYNTLGEFPHFRVINKGIPGINSNFILSKLEENLKECKPDMVVSMIGINDIRQKLAEMMEVAKSQYGGTRLLGMIEQAPATAPEGEVNDQEAPETGSGD